VLAGQASPAAAVNPRAAAAADTAMRILISVDERRLWVVAGAADTLLATPVAVGSGRTLTSGARAWTFRTPRGIRTVLSKEVDPVWVRPDWSYVEAARKHGLRLEYLAPATPRALAGGASLVVRGGVVGVAKNGTFDPLLIEDEVVFDGVLFVPPVDSRNRRVPGQLGRFRLNLGGGIGLHGTPEKASIGQAVTHGCIRLGDEPLAWLHERIAVGTRVYIF
jgi:lipoprotein-anchoring transpeptidase ErfK/SrfK